MASNIRDWLPARLGYDLAYVTWPHLLHPSSLSFLATVSTCESPTEEALSTPSLPSVTKIITLLTTQSDQRVRRSGLWIAKKGKKVQCDVGSIKLSRLQRHSPLGTVPSRIGLLPPMLISAPSLAHSVIFTLASLLPFKCTKHAPSQDLCICFSLC